MLSRGKMVFGFGFFEELLGLGPGRFSRSTPFPGRFWLVVSKSGCRMSIAVIGFPESSSPEDQGEIVGPSDIENQGEFS
jgi:hypothetical protein